MIKTRLETEGSVSKEQGVSGVKTSSVLEPASYVRRFISAASSRGFRVEPFGEVDSCPLVALTRRTSGRRPRVYVSAGIHGDEPAPPAALLQLLESDVFDARANWFLVPMLNPTGFTHGTRENADAIDLNRDYLSPRSSEITAHLTWLQSQPRFDLALCLHEDWEATGFYLYELNPEQRPTLASVMVATALRHMPIDPAGMIDGRPVAEQGIIRPEHEPIRIDQWPEALYLLAHHTSLCYTLETPSAYDFDGRVATLHDVVKASIDVACAK